MVFFRSFPRSERERSAIGRHSRRGAAKVAIRLRRATIEEFLKPTSRQQSEVHLNIPLNLSHQPASGFAGFWMLLVRPLM